MNRIESTLEEPLLFLKRVIQLDGEEYLRFLFENPSAANCWYNQETGYLNCIKILPWNDARGHLLDKETNEREYELIFPEFVKEEFDHQNEITKRLIYNQIKQNGKGQNEDLYSVILIECLEAQKYVDSKLDLNFKEYLNDFIRNILTYVYTKFEKRFPKTSEIQHVKKYYRTRNDSNTTGYKLKAEVKVGRQFKDFIEYLYRHEIVSKSTNEESIRQFFYCEIPKCKIDFQKDPHELWYFIKNICNDKILENMPGQKWKYLDQIFTCKGVDLKKDWCRNNNKLKDQEKRQPLFDLTLMLKPRN